MPSYDDCTLSSSRNAFSPSFLHRISQRDEPPTAGEADVAGPWRILEMPGRRFGVFRLGESPERGHRPAAVFRERWLALQPRRGAGSFLTAIQFCIRKGDQVGDFELPGLDSGHHRRVRSLPSCPFPKRGGAAVPRAHEPGTTRTWRGAESCSRFPNSS
jgi:hypothetical protein